MSNDQRAALIAESRGIDTDTARELVYLRDHAAALQAQLDTIIREREHWKDLAQRYAVASHLHSTEAVNLASDLTVLCGMEVEDFRRRAVEAVPTSWLDSLLTGPQKVIGEPPWKCPDIERLLRALKERITSLPAKEEGVDESGKAADAMIDAHRDAQGQY